MGIVVNKHGLVYLDFRRAGSISLQLYLICHRLLHVRVAVNSHVLPVHKNRITSLLCIFETIILCIFETTILLFDRLKSDLQLTSIIFIQLYYNNY